MPRAAWLLPIDGRTILGSSFFTTYPTSNPAKNGHGYFGRLPQYWLTAFAVFATTRAAYIQPDCQLQRPHQKGKESYQCLCLLPGAHKRLGRHKNNLQRQAKATQEAAKCLASFRTSTTTGGRDRGSTSTVTTRSATAMKGRGKERSSHAANLGLATCPFIPQLLYDKQATRMTGRKKA